VLYADQAEREMVHFEDPLKDYMQLVSSVKVANLLSYQPFSKILT
jgi:hypothetical protein